MLENPTQDATDDRNADGSEPHAASRRARPPGAAPTPSLRGAVSAPLPTADPYPRLERQGRNDGGGRRSARSPGRGGEMQGSADPDCQDIGLTADFPAAHGIAGHTHRLHRPPPRQRVTKPPRRGPASAAPAGAWSASGCPPESPPGDNAPDHPARPEAGRAPDRWRQSHGNWHK